MSTRKLLNQVYAVGAIDWSRSSFDELTPLHEGTSYNAYLIKGSEKTALIDTVEPKTMHTLLQNLKKLDVKRIDYVISNHAEQDHSGSIAQILKIYPEAKVVTNEKCKGFLKDLVLLKENDFLTVNDGDELSLGDKTLKFTLFPWVHWPETMFTFIKEDRLLFSGDLFGSHIADCSLKVEDKSYVEQGAKVYFAEIMFPFRNHISKNFSKIEEMNPAVIAPTHGPVHEEPGWIMDLYREWISEKLSNKVLIPFISMHGSTENMTEYLVSALIERGIGVKPFNLSGVDVGKYAVELMDAATVVVGTPTVLGSMHPNAAYAVYFTNMLRPKTKFLSVIGSYEWGGKTVKDIQAMLNLVKAEVIDPVYIKGFPTEEVFQSLDRLADQIKEKHQSIGLV